MSQTITKHIGEGFARGELYAALAYDETDQFGGMQIKQIKFSPASGKVAINVGTEASPATLTTSNQAMLIYTTSASTSGTQYGTIIDHTQTGASATIIECLRVNIDSEVRTGSWANAVSARINYGTAGDGAGGLASVVCAEMNLPNKDMHTLGGNYYCFDAEINIPANTVLNDSATYFTAFMKFATWGSGNTEFDDHGFLFHTDGLTSGTGSLLYTNSLKINIEGTAKYLVYGDAEQGLHLGTSGSKATLVASTPYLSVYTTSSVITGTIQSMVISQTMTAAATASYLEVLNVTLTSDVKTGGNANAIFAKLDYVTDGYANGECGVICAELSMPASSVVRGEYNVWKTELDCPTSCVMNNNPINIFGIHVWGGATTQFDTYGYLFNITGVAAPVDDTEAMWHLTKDVAPTHALRCKILGVDYDILMVASVYSSN